MTISRSLTLNGTDTAVAGTPPVVADAINVYPMPTVLTASEGKVAMPLASETATLPDNVAGPGSAPSVNVTWAPGTGVPVRLSRTCTLTDGAIAALTRT